MMTILERDSMRLRHFAILLFVFSTWMLPGCGSNIESTESSLEDVKASDAREAAGKTEEQLDAEEDAEDAE